MREAGAMGRPCGFDEQEALAAIMAVFWAKGFEGTSMRDLVAATGLKKGSLYAAFGNRRAIYRLAIELYDREWIGSLTDTLCGSRKPLERIERFLQTAMDLRKGTKGCFLCNAAIDQASADAAAKRVIKRSLARLESALLETVAELSLDSPERAARHLLSVYFGLRVLAKAGSDAAALQDAKESALKVLVARQAKPNDLGK